MDRKERLDALESKTWDLLVIGGGATGAGVALDAVSRGLKVALIERGDFSSGTSSRSTKLIHGGVRYLEQAVIKFDRGQFKLVREALHERSTLIKIAPHLVHWLPIVTPLYHMTDVPYYRTGLKVYDWLAGKHLAFKSRFIDGSEALRRCPILKPEGLRGAVVYYDGQFDDARMNVSIILTAQAEGALPLNYVELSGFEKREGRLTSALWKDALTGREGTVRAKVFVNATGPYTDSVRQFDDPQAPPLLSVSSGTHLVLSRRFSAPEVGLLIPKTDDGRVLFLLPWMGHTVVGTTDTPCAVSDDPHPTKADTSYILKQLKKCFSMKVSEADILASWTGLRPLVGESLSVSTAKLSRDHVLLVSPSGLVTITGGKWTTYRRMAEDTVDEALKVGQLKPLRKSRTESLKLRGAQRYHPNGAEHLKTEFGLPLDVCQAWHKAYGDCAPLVARIAQEGFEKRLVEGHPILEADVIYAAREEMALTSSDFLSRRTRLTFLDEAAAAEAAPRVHQLMSQTLKWTPKEREQDRKGLPTGSRR